ncbi:hypothetical protein [Peribacillus muralis]|uniref:hypothetical protein n=1 Tax=Peribacillus muralis TaxID=264697 RepID=UPI003CFE8695
MKKLSIFICGLTFALTIGVVVANQPVSQKKDLEGNNTGLITPFKKDPGGLGG